jgi:translation elongation factor EF-Ts
MRRFVSAALLLLAVSSRLFAEQTEHARVAEQFARTLAEHKYAEAAGMLTATLQKEYSAEQLKTSFEQMIPENEPVTHIEVMEQMTKWPDKKNGDIGWAYVVISAETYSEGIAVVIAKEGTGAKVRAVEWGRP